jgi:hypothetical protein
MDESAGEAPLVRRIERNQSICGINRGAGEDDMTRDGPVGSVESPAGTTAAPARRTALQLGFELPTAGRNARILLVRALVTWVPILLLALAAGLVIGSRVEVPVLGDPSFYSRYLLALPLLIVAELVVATSLAVRLGSFLESGLVPRTEQTRYKDSEAELKRLYNSIVAQGGDSGLVVRPRTIVNRASLAPQTSG